MSAAKVEIAKHLNITDLGKACTFVGLQISRNHPERSITIHQTSYITRVLERFGMLDSRVVHTPLNPSVMLTPSTEEELSSPDFPYTAVIGSRIYAAVTTCPNISHAIQHLSQFTSNFSQTHITAVKQVLRYLNGTRNLGITYWPTSDPEVLGYTDADWAQDTLDRKSTSGYVFLLSGGAISWSSKKQTSVALSTMEAEFVALSHATKDTLWLRTLLTDLGFPPSGVLCNFQITQNSDF